MSPASGKVQLFVDRDYRGANVSLDEGAFNIGQSTGAVENDTVSSLKVASGYSVAAYADSDCTGNCIIFTADTPYVGDAMNDRISSVAVKATPEITKRLGGSSGFPPPGNVYNLQNPIELIDGGDVITMVTFPVTVTHPE
jgi:hypothetical protein